ncbi:MAG: undecaprenyldiphospho-muramoylpentapeptide beta-N-acetylglucosaminyltransferase [Deltaproteobacteria bacterium]|uniref:UDP-N-acetylglucosamine--N-acetylmuramyl-(pentapeptide) pyrophosphoryl-undecaprenol N-acetylglucosamine transferase n=1 Tax=Candidatus Zymogenus saltonus TaxID=2844893 RepID=A0A9D8KER0_9DELT|nr:undecaprenyldiphospho-muramoylpentapeptide beta-N-acetylglucosaminyltransferase [Candidatus Zymogenus saltonus]
MKVVIAGGGTGGHLFSGLAVYERLMEMGGNSAYFIGTRDGIEAEILPKMGLDVSFIPVSKFRRSGIRAKAVSLLLIPASVLSALRYILRIRPDVTLGVGGFASGPTVLASILRGIPTAVIEQNSVAGFTNRLLGRWVKRAFLGLPGAEEAFPQGIGLFTGNPVRKSLFDIPPVDEKRDSFCVLVFGGSQGARRINELVTDCLEWLRDYRERIEFIHLTGPSDYAWVKDKYDKSGVRAEIYDFKGDMESLYKRADWVISRSGAMTVSELSAAGRPSLLIPYPFAVDDHQAKNAQYLVDARAAVMFRQERLSGDKIAEMIISAMSERGELSRMGRRAREAARRDAAEAIAKDLFDLVGEN